ncbi:MAG: type II toxin-antitoxin system HicA family toxin [Gemmatimonadetes bacterium]|nr:type II toxin-antitoxin system HicA family toxin [Gemmatimonadota bacterium]MYB59173.1 type II toxin-antitoxin system HicA family toxin [Gemmatimonadota bacterium]
MPRKIRELIKDLEAAGFVNRGGRGSHRKFVHSKVSKSVVLSGQLGDDAKHYQEKDVKVAIEVSKR